MQDAHPFNFFEDKQGQITILDPEDISVDTRFADLANVNVYKIVRGVLNGKIQADNALELLESTVEGYNSQAKEQLTYDEIENMADVTLAVYLNHLPQFGYIFRLDPRDINQMNLAFTGDSFIKGFDALQKASLKMFNLSFLMFLGKHKPMIQALPFGSA